MHACLLLLWPPQAARAAAAEVPEGEPAVFAAISAANEVSLTLF
jgi:hypothetical protein